MKCDRCNCRGTLGLYGLTALCAVCALTCALSGLWPHSPLTTWFVGRA